MCWLKINFNIIINIIRCIIILTNNLLKPGQLGLKGVVGSTLEFSHNFGAHLLLNFVSSHIADIKFYMDLNKFTKVRFHSSLTELEVAPIL